MLYGSGAGTPGLRAVSLAPGKASAQKPAVEESARVEEEDAGEEEEGPGEALFVEGLYPDVALALLRQGTRRFRTASCRHRSRAGAGAG